MYRRIINIFDKYILKNEEKVQIDNLITNNKVIWVCSLSGCT